MRHDPTLDTLLHLDGESFVVEENGAFWVRFVVKRVPTIPEKPHGLDYSLTLHDSTGKRLLGFDNAHPVKEGSGPGARTRVEFDHKHKGNRVHFYDYSDAATLLEDFWNDVYRVLHERSS